MTVANDSTRIAGLLRVGFIVDRALMQLVDLDPAAPRVSDPVVMKTLEGFLTSVMESTSNVWKGGTASSGGAINDLDSVAQLDWDLVASNEGSVEGADWVTFLDKLRSTVRSIVGKEPVAPTEISQLRSFLRTVSRVSLTQAQSAKRCTSFPARHDETWQAIFAD